MSSADWKETLAKVKISSEETGFHEDEFLSLEDLVTVNATHPFRPGRAFS